MIQKTLFASGLVVFTGCTVGPDYVRPEYPVPQSPDDVVDDTMTSLGDLEWFQAFDDPVLQDLVRTALEQNYDVRIAAERVIEARARVKITRAERFPDIRAGGIYEATKGAENVSNPLPEDVDAQSEVVQLLGDLTWEIDFWGRIARATEAARAELLATEFARRTVIQTLVADLALAYFDLLELDGEIEISRRTYVSRQSSYDLVALRLEQGVSNKVELYQAEGSALQAAGIIPDLERRIEQQENLIQLLIGANPGPVPRGFPLLEQKRHTEVPAGLPSELLRRRPDVHVAEQNLVAANARIGEAMAQLYPAIRLTAVGGIASQDLTNLFEGDSTTWSITPSIVQPIFNAGRLRSNVHVTEAQQRQATLAYMQTLQQAFLEVANSLVAREKSAEVRVWKGRLEEVLREQAELSQERYLGGVTSYLEVLDSDRDHFSAELDLVRSIRDELFAFVLLYRSLGGGWQEAEKLAASGN
ncbi:MAG: transporter [Planctomycetes bacterium]|nr:transporter [Planctomycetota bacterium]